MKLEELTRTSIFQAEEDLKEARQYLKQGELESAGLLSVQSAVNTLTAVCYLGGRIQNPTYNVYDLLNIGSEILPGLPNLKPEAELLDTVQEFRLFSDHASGGKKITTELVGQFIFAAEKIFNAIQAKIIEDKRWIPAKKSLSSPGGLKRKIIKVIKGVLGVFVLSVPLLLPWNAGSQEIKTDSKLFFEYYDPSPVSSPWDILTFRNRFLFLLIREKCVDKNILNSDKFTKMGKKKFSENFDQILPEFVSRFRDLSGYSIPDHPLSVWYNAVKPDSQNPLFSSDVNWYFSHFDGLLFYPYPEFVLNKSAQGYQVSVGKCQIDINSNRNPQTGKQITYWDPSDFRFINDKIDAKITDKITTDELIYLQWGFEPQINAELRSFFISALYGLNSTYFQNSLTTANGFLPSIYENNFPRIKTDLTSRAQSVWKSRQLFINYSIPRLWYPDYPIFAVLAEEIKERLEKIVGIKLILVPKKLNEIYSANPEDYEIIINSSTMDELNFFDLWKDESDIPRSVENLNLKSLNEKEMKQKFSLYFPLWWISILGYQY